MAYIVLVMTGQSLDQCERAVGPFTTEADAFDWCVDEQIDPDEQVANERWGAIRRLDPP